MLGKIVLVLIGVLSVLVIALGSPIASPPAGICITLVVATLVITRELRKVRDAIEDARLTPAQLTEGLRAAARKPKVAPEVPAKPAGEDST
jgi:hypothetical protein